MKPYAGVAALFVVAGCSTQQGNVSTPVAAPPVAPTVKQPVPLEPAMSLKYAPLPGSSLPYSIVMMASDGQRQTTTQINLTERLTTSGPNRFTSVVALDSLLQNGAIPPGLGNRVSKYKLTIVRDGHGTVVNSAAVGGKGLIEPHELESRTSFTLPDKPIRVGDSWTSTSSFGGKAVKQLFRVDSVGTISGRDCVFFSETDESSDGTKLPPKGIAVDKQTGELVRQVFDLQKPGQGSSPGVHMRLEVLLHDATAGKSPAVEQPN
jgi:hypothetical protein